MPSPHQNRERIMRELELTFIGKASDPNLRSKIVDSCRFRFGLNKVATIDYGEIVYERIMYETRSGKGLNDAQHPITEQEYHV